MKKYILLLFSFYFLRVAVAQEFKAPPQNWFNLDPKYDDIQGVGAERAYSKILKKKKNETVVVAIIDSGVDTEHEDLKGIIWVNEDEVPNNGIDDDKNGYIDDINGWNFIGGKDGRNINYETLEITRLYTKYDQKFKSKVLPSDSDEYERFLKIKKEYQAKQSEAEQDYARTKEILVQCVEVNNMLKEKMGLKEVNVFTLNNIKKEIPGMADAIDALIMYLESDGYESLDQFIAEVEYVVNHYKNQLDYGLNPTINERAIVGDNPDDFSDRYYGNNDVKGPDAEHGTHVAGIIGANRNNEIGIKGVANNVKLMVVRAVPNGDERDKDISNAIRYAVDNGAKVINMSFGKAYSQNKLAVDEAVKYAESKDVLIVHAAGNESLDIDKNQQYPNPFYEEGSKERALNWIEVGALQFDTENPKSLVLASFSNYGKNVDVFSPGTKLYSTIPDNKYKNNSGTSMASPVVAGVAAVIRSYYPKLTAQQVREIIIKSSYSVNNKSEIKLDSEEEEIVDISSVCSCEGYVSLTQALELAKKYK